MTTSTTHSIYDDILIFFVRELVIFNMNDEVKEMKMTICNKYIFLKFF
jgi:hypothetical protein